LKTAGQEGGKKIVSREAPDVVIAKTPISMRKEGNDKGKRKKEPPKERKGKKKKVCAENVEGPLGIPQISQKKVGISLKKLRGKRFQQKAKKNG